MDHIFIFLTKKFGLLPNSKTSTSKFFPRLYRIHLNTDQSFGWQPLLAGPSNKKRCHEIIQDQTRSAELICYKPTIFPCCSNSALFSLLCDTILHLVISPDPFFLLSSVCLKTNEEIFKHWTTLCTEKSYSLTYNDSLYPDRCYHFVLQCYECWCYTSEWASVIWSSCLPVLHAKSWDQVF